MLEELLKKYNLKLNKNRDQFFLKNEKILDFEVNCANISKEETILEIGAGIGTLTKKLAEKAKKVYAIEKDKTLIPILKNNVKDHKNVEIIRGDILEITLPKFDKCVSNIPYKISSKITELLAKNKIFSIICYQKEFAKRLISEPTEKEYSRISILSNFYFTPVFLKEVSKKQFIPEPKVDSMIIKLVPKNFNYKVNEELFFKIVSALFVHKNKKVRNSFYNSRVFFNLEKEQAKKLIKNMPYKEIRVISLSIEKLLEIYNYISNKCK